MRKVLLILSCCSAVLFGACTNEKSPGVEVENRNEFEFVGKSHNDGLAYVLGKLKAAPRTRSGGPDLESVDILELVEDFLSEEFELPEEYMEVVSEELRYFIENKSYLLEYDPNDFTARQMGFLTRLDEIMNDGDEDLSSLLARLKALERMACAELPEEESAPVLMGIAVAQNTLQYWYDYLDDWAGTFGVPMTRANDFSCKRVGNADVAGAVAGGIHSSARHLLKVGPIGWKAWLGFVVGGAAALSVVDALKQLDEDFAYNPIDDKVGDDAGESGTIDDPGELDAGPAEDYQP